MLTESGTIFQAAWVRAEIETLLAALAANPDLVRFCLVAPPAAGEEVAGAYREFLQRLLGVLVERRPARGKKPAPVAEYGLVGGLAGRWSQPPNVAARKRSRRWGPMRWSWC